MTRAFGERERQLVKESLLDAGDTHIGLVGFSKTSIDDITHAAGVAKGTFYTFWSSKEEFFFACLERAERRFQDEVVAPILNSAVDPADALGRLVAEAFDAMDDYPIISRALDPHLMSRLSRRLPPETMEAHRKTDRLEFADIMAAWNTNDFDPGISPDVFDGIFKGLLMMRLHKEIIGMDVFPEVTRTMSRIFAAGLRSLSDERRGTSEHAERKRRK